MNNHPPVSFQPAVTPEARMEVIRLLRQHQLPVNDLGPDQALFLLMEEGKGVGTGGLEMFDDCVLLRSVSVDSSRQGKGYGAFITRELESYAAGKGIGCLYLLTTTADRFFARQGYTVVSREAVPAAIRQTAEFAALCPATVVVMKKAPG